MDEIVVGLEVLSIAAFVVLTGFGLVRARRGSRPARRLAAAFASLATILLVGIVLPESAPAWMTKVLLAVLLAFPFLLFRFTSSLEPGHRPTELAAAAAYGVLLVVSLALPAIPEADAERPAWFGVYLVLVLAYWTALSTIVVVRLWRAGRGHPTLTRRRMRLMSIAVAGLNAGILVAGTDPGASVELDLLVQGLVFLTAVAFLLGFAPPRILRLAWRRPEQQAAREALHGLLRAQSRTEVAEVVLPHAAALVGATQAAMVDADGTLIAAHGAGEELLEAIAIDGGREEGAGAHLRVPMGEGHGDLVVWPTSYTPIFGRDDLLAVQDIGTAAALALERAELLERERTVAEDASRARSAAERATLAKNDFLSSMSHELRTPLNAILGFGQLLEMAELGEPHGDSVRHIVQAGRHLLDLVNEVLDLARIEAGRLSLSPEPVEVDRLVREAVDLMLPAAADRGITVETALEGCDVHIHADRQRLKQVLLNLLSNAVKYNRDGGTVDVRCERRTDARIRISVRDTGPGIAPERRAGLFEPFDRLGAEQSAIEGTGLGLALARQLVEAMGGSIDVDSVPGEGSTFWVELAITASPLSSYELDAGEAEPRDTAGEARRTLLLIEDNLSNLRLVERILETRPHVSVLSAMQGGLGLELARQHRPDLIVLDLHLPDIPGDQLLHRLLADPATRSIPVVVASADATEGRIRRLLGVGAAEYLTKPIEVQRLLELVDRFLAPDDGTPPAGLRSSS
jgi:signal transduction histidine kinase/ActR/RegA family two-component response regulator